MEIVWSEFKKIVNAKSLSIQFVEHSGNYHLKAVDGVFVLDCVLPIGVADPDTVDFETSYKASGNKKLSTALQAFDAKELPNGKKLFRRSHGVTVTLNASGNTTVDFLVPYNNCKMNKMEVVWQPEGVKLDLQVLDTAACSIQAAMGVPVEYRVPNLMLNQFEFDVVAPKDYYADESKYDADLIKDMVIRVVLKNSTSESKLIGLNFILHEVK